MTAQSWLDLPVMPTMDPRSLIQTCTFEDQAGATQPGAFKRSTNWLQTTTWVSPVIKVTAYGVSSPTNSFLSAANPQDFTSVEEAATWNGTHVMTTNNPQLPLVSEGLMFLHAGSSFINNIFFDLVAATSTDVQISFRDNSYTNGDFANSATGTIPVYAFPTTTTYGGTGRLLTLTLLQTGRFHMGLRIVDNTGNYSLFPMEWVVL